MGESDNNPQKSIDIRDIPMFKPTKTHSSTETGE